MINVPSDILKRLRIGNRDASLTGLHGIYNEEICQNLNMVILYMYMKVRKTHEK